MRGPESTGALLREAPTLGSRPGTAPRVLSSVRSEPPPPHPQRACFDGTTPSSVALPPGRHYLRLYNPYFRSLEREIWIDSDETLAIDEALEELAPGEAPSAPPTEAPAPGAATDEEPLDEEPLDEEPLDEEPATEPVEGEGAAP